MNPLKIAVAVGVFIALGFFVERAKVSLNHYLDFGAQIQGFDAMDPAEREAALKRITPQVPYDYYYNHGRVDLYHGFALRELTRLKWAMAVGFVALYLGLALFFLGWMDVGSTAKRYLYIYVAIATLFVVLFFGLSRMPVNQQAAYAVARKLLGFLHSPLPLLLAVFTVRIRGAIS